MARPKQSTNKVKASIWLDPATHDGLKRLAEEARLSVSEFCNVHLRKLVKEEAAEAQADLVAERLERAMLRAVAKVGDRLAYLSSTASIEASSTRRVLFQLLVKEFGEGQANTINLEARKAAVRAMRQEPDDLLKEILALRDPEGERDG